MARKTRNLDDIFAKTGGDSDQDLASIDLDESPTVSTGLGIRTGELKAITLLADRLGITKNALMRFAIRYVLTAVRDGKINIDQFIEIPPEPKKDIKMPK